MNGARQLDLCSLHSGIRSQVSNSYAKLIPAGRLYVEDCLAFPFANSWLPAYRLPLHSRPCLSSISRLLQLLPSCSLLRWRKGSWARALPSKPLSCYSLPRLFFSQSGSARERHMGLYLLCIKPKQHWERCWMTQRCSLCGGHMTGQLAASGCSCCAHPLHVLSLQ